MNKTKVILQSKEIQCDIEVGTEGYIDGYVQAADGRPYAVVVFGETIELIKFNNLKVIKEQQ